MTRNCQSANKHGGGSGTGGAGVGVKRAAITKHLGNIFQTGELVEDSVSSILEHTAGDGTKYYNLDAIIAVGYRVNS